MEESEEITDNLMNVHFAATKDLIFSYCPVIYVKDTGKLVTFASPRQVTLSESIQFQKRIS